MGALIVGGVIAAAGAGYSAYAANEAAGDSQANISGFRKNIKGAMRHIPKVAPVTFDRLSLEKPSEVFGSYLDQQKQLPKLARFAERQNDSWSALLDKASPGLTASVKAGGRLVSSRLAGELSAETQGNIARSGAYRSLQNGYGPGSTGNRALEARDLGRTSEDLSTQGFAMVPQQMQMAGALTPVSAHGQLFTPGQLAQRSDMERTFNTSVSNSERAYNTSIEFENKNARFQALLNSAGIQYSANQQGINISAARDAQIGSSIQQVGGAVAGAGGGGNGSGGVDWSKVGGQLGFGSQTQGAATTNANGFYGTQAAAQGAYGSGANLAFYGSNTRTGGWYNQGYS